MTQAFKLNFFPPQPGNIYKTQIFFVRQRNKRLNEKNSWICVRKARGVIQREAETRRASAEEWE